MLNTHFLHTLTQIVPSHALLTDREDTRPYECDALTLYRQLPGAVVLPETEQQVVAILRACHQANVPVVARGAGTGLSGGSLPLEHGVLLSLAKFNRILAIDPLTRTAKVQPGVRNLALSEAVQAYGLFYAPDPSSQIACTIGGNVAENSGGVHCLKYGLTLHNLRRVRVVLMNGEITEIGGQGLDSPGYDLLALLTGSEGLLGVITEITVKLTPKPPAARCVLACFDDLDQAGNAVAAVIAAGIIPAGLEMMDKLTIHAVEPFVQAGYPLQAEAILLCESDGTNEEIAVEIQRITEVMRLNGATQIRVSTDEAERLRFWSGRKAAFPAAGRISPDYYCMDGTIPRRELGRVLTAIATLSKEYGLACMNVFHAGDGNLHPLILFDANKPGDVAKCEAFGARILELCIAVGGTITGEHGVGVEKIDQMCLQFRADELTLFHGIKKAFDPQCLLNPGKAVPTLHRCAEFGAMRVHKGQLAHPELPRF